MGIVKDRKSSYRIRNKKSLVAEADQGRVTVRVWSDIDGDLMPVAMETSALGSYVGEPEHVLVPSFLSPGGILSALGI